MKEIFLPIKDFEGYYISNKGNVKSTKSKEEGVILKPGICNKYYNVVLLKDRKRHNRTIHSLVAEMFLGFRYDPLIDLVIDHIDNNKLNNWITNLQIITYSENCSKDKKNKTSKFNGVSLHPDGRFWISNISYKKQRVYLGIYKSEEEAQISYKEVYIKIQNNSFDLDNFLKEREKTRIRNYTSKYKGVSWSKQNNKWCAEIWVNRKKISLGYYTNEEEAADICNRAYTDVKNKTFIKEIYILERNSRKCKIRNKTSTDGQI